MPMGWRDWRMGERAPRGLCTFRERDVRAIIHAVEKAGKEVHAVEVDREGRIRILTRPLETAVTTEADGKGWEDV